MRILHVLTEPHGGGGAYALALARAAAARGDDVLVATTRPFTTEFPELPLRARTLPRLLRISTRADVSHVHGVRAAALRPFLRSRTVVVTTHGLHALRAAEGGLRLRVVRNTTRELLRWVDRIICVSEAEARAVEAFGRSWRRRTRVVLNGVPGAVEPTPAEQSAAREELGLRQDAPVALFLGSLIHQKNPQLAAQAAAIAQRSLPGLVVLVAGEGPLRPELEALGADCVRLLGHRSDVDRLLAATDVVVNTSRWEGLSLALLEALWRARPVVATDAPGNSEAVGDAGFVVAPSATAIADALVRVLSQPTLRAELGRRARSRAESLFDEERMVARTLAVYDEVAAAAR